MKWRIGVLGGTFNPVHNGHLGLAEFCRKKLGFDHVLFVTAKDPPHKKVAGNVPPEDRHRMVQLAVAPYPFLRASDLELRRKGPSYTVKTLRQLKELWPGAELFFLIGADTAPELRSWYRLPEILDLAQIVTVSRPGYEPSYRQEDLPELTPEKIARLNQYILPMPPFPESSTQIREKVARGEPIAGLVPPQVAEFIARRGLYRPQPD